MSIFTPLKNIFNISTKAKVRPYKLAERKDFLPINQYDNKLGLEISPNADTFSYLNLVKNSDETSSKELLTFYDNKKRPIYYLFFKDNNYYKRIFVSYFVNTKKFAIDKFIPLGKSNFGDRVLGAWQFVKNKTLHVLSYEIDRGKKFIVTSRTMTPESGVDCPTWKYELVKYPELVKTSKGTKKDSEKSFLSAIIQSKYDGVELSDLKYSKNLNLDKDDKFLPYRILNPKSSIGARSITEYYLKQKGLEKLNIPVYTGFHEYDSGRAYFESVNGSISMNHNERKFILPECIVCDAAHEVEHAWQHAIAGRAGFVNSPYESSAKILLGELSDANLIKLAKDYAYAIRIYPNMAKTSFDDPRYRNNLLEIDARKAGEQAAEDYKKSNNYNIFMNIFRNGSFN